MKASWIIEPFCFQEKRQVAKEKLIEMEEEMEEATAQLKAREAEKIERVSSIRLVVKISRLLLNIILTNPIGPFQLSSLMFI